MRFENWVYTIPLRVRSLIRRNRLDAELAEELCDHINRQIEQNVASGMRHPQAGVQRSDEWRRIEGTSCNKDESRSN